MSKLAAGRAKDVVFVRVLLREHVVDPEVLRARIDGTAGMDAARKTLLRQLVTRLSP